MSFPNRVADAAMTFADLGVPRDLIAVLAEREISPPSISRSAPSPTPWPGATSRGKAPTGSGKTLAFGIPLVERVPGRPRRAAAARPRARPDP